MRVYEDGTENALSLNTIVLQGSQTNYPMSKFT